MKEEIESELEREIQEAEKVLEKYDSSLSLTKIKGMVLNNFHQYLPGHCFRVAIEKIQSELDIPIGEANRRFDERCGLNYNDDKILSEKYLSTSYKQFFQDFDSALEEASSEAIMQSLHDLSERNHRLYDERKDCSHPKPIEQLGKTIDEQIDVLYRAYLILRRQGYFKLDLTA
jgi:hypothetical protein